MNAGIRRTEEEISFYGSYKSKECFVRSKILMCLLYILIFNVGQAFGTDWENDRFAGRSYAPTGKTVLEFLEKNAELLAAGQGDIDASKFSGSGPVLCTQVSMHKMVLKIKSINTGLEQGVLKQVKFEDCLDPGEWTTYAYKLYYNNPGGVLSTGKLVLQS